MTSRDDVTPGHWPGACRRVFAASRLASLWRQQVCVSRDTPVERVCRASCCCCWRAHLHDFRLTLYQASITRLYSRHRSEVDLNFGKGVFICVSQSLETGNWRAIGLVAEIMSFLSLKSRFSSRSEKLNKHRKKFELINSLSLKYCPSCRTDAVDVTGWNDHLYIFSGQLCSIN